MVAGLPTSLRRSRAIRCRATVMQCGGMSSWNHYGHPGESRVFIAQDALELEAGAAALDEDQDREPGRDEGAAEGDAERA